MGRGGFLMELNHESSFLLEDGWVFHDFMSEEIRPRPGGAIYLYRHPNVPPHVARVTGLSSHERSADRYVERIRFVIYHTQGYRRDDRKPVIVYQLDGKILFGYAYF